MLIFTKWIALIQFLQLLEWLAAQPVNSGSDTLKSVQIMFRHGIREPDKLVMQPTGRLTEKGKKQMYDLGMYYRQRYGRFLQSAYNENEISIWSSDHDRTIQSASLVAYGLYNDFNSAANWSGEGNVQFEPIPVRTIPENRDKYIQLSAQCPRRQEIQGNVMESYFARYLQENPDIVEYYYKQTGDATIVDSSKGSRQRINKFVVTQEEITMNLTNNLPVVDWAIPLLKNEAFLSVETVGLRLGVATLEQKRLNTGSLVGLFIENMEAPSATRKNVLLLSGHDRTIIMLLYTLGIYDTSVLTMPPTGSSFIVELHEAFGLGARPYVKFLYRNDTRKEPHVLEIPNCGTPCYLSTFKDLTKEIIPDDFDAECTPVIDPILKSFAPTASYQMKIALYATITISLLITVVIFQIILIKRRNYDRL